MLFFFSLRLSWPLHLVLPVGSTMKTEALRNERHFTVVVVVGESNFVMLSFENWETGTKKSQPCDEPLFSK